MERAHIMVRLSDGPMRASFFSVRRVQPRMGSLLMCNCLMLSQSKKR